MHENHGFFADCEQCQRAMSSVMDANLLLFKTVIAGDSWGEIAVPVIQEHPWTSVIFVGSMLTLVFGVVNLIVAVVSWPQMDMYVSISINTSNTSTSRASRERKFQGEKAVQAKAPIAFRMCAGPPTRAMPKPSFLRALAFSRSDNGALVVAGCVSVVWRWC